VNNNDNSFEESEDSETYMKDMLKEQFELRKKC